MNAGPAASRYPGGRAYALITKRKRIGCRADPALFDRSGPSPTTNRAMPASKGFKS
jgi:hypothetical protein